MRGQGPLLSAAQHGAWKQAQVHLVEKNQCKLYGNLKDMYH